MRIALIIGVWLLPGRLVARLEETRSQLLVDWLRVLPPAFAALATIATGRFLDDQVNLTGQVNVVALLCAIAISYFFAALATFRLVVAVIETLFSRAAADDRFQNLVGVGARVLGFLTALIVFVYGIGGLGIDVLPVLAGLGVGGLAVALAIRPTLENIIGGVILYSDRRDWSGRWRCPRPRALP